MGKEVVNFVHKFYEKWKLLKALSPSVFALVPKKDNPQTLYEYRLICLIGCMHKVVSKLLAVRLKKFVANIISLTHTVTP